jgi:hypothetical protein
MATRGKKQRRNGKKLAAKLPVPAKQPQPHGGAIYNGGVPGHAGAGGRPPSAIKATARDLFDARLPKLARIADTAERDGDRIRAIEVLGRFGLDMSLSVRDVGQALDETAAEIRRSLPDDQASALIERIRPIWRALRPT